MRGTVGMQGSGLAMNRHAARGWRIGALTVVGGIVLAIGQGVAEPVQPPAAPPDNAAATEPASAAHTGAREVIERLHTELLGVLKEAQALGYQGRYDRISPAIDTAFDLPFMAEKTVGRYWKDLGAEGRTQWIRAFGDLTKANYAARFDHYANQRFEMLGEEAGAYDTVMVRSQVIDPGAENVELTYRLKENGAGWKIVDVYLKGTVSELALRRSEYTAVVGREGFPALLTQVNGKVAALAEGAAVAP